MAETVGSITSGYTDDGRDYVAGVNCYDCGRFVGRDGSIAIGTFEMSNEVAYVDGQCARCAHAEAVEYAKRQAPASSESEEGRNDG